MLSRVAEAIFWMNRYVERAENVARFVDVNLHLALDFPEADAQWEPLVATTGDADQYRARYGTISRGEVLQFLTFDRDNPSSIWSCLSAARENARSVRDVVSSEVFEQVNRAFLSVNDAARAGTALDAPHDFYTQVKLASHLFVGTMDLTMTHNEGWHFGRLGRMLERADKTSRILDLKSEMLATHDTELPSPTDELHWSAVLRSASAFEMYRKERGNVLPVRVVEFLILNDRFPRSVLYCLNKADGSLHAITGTQRGSGSLRPERELGKLASELAYAEVNDILDRTLHVFVDELQLRMDRVSEEITSTFFAVPLAGTESKPKTLPPLSTARP